MGVVHYLYGLGKPLKWISLLIFFTLWITNLNSQTVIHINANNKPQIDSSLITFNNIVIKEVTGSEMVLEEKYFDKELTIHKSGFKSINFIPNQTSVINLTTVYEQLDSIILTNMKPKDIYETIKSDFLGNSKYFTIANSIEQISISSDNNLAAELIVERDYSEVRKSRTISSYINNAQLKIDTLRKEPLMLSVFSRLHNINYHTRGMIHLSNRQPLMSYSEPLRLLFYQDIKFKITNENNEDNGILFLESKREKITAKIHYSFDNLNVIQIELLQNLNNSKTTSSIDHKKNAKIKEVSNYYEITTTKMGQNLYFEKYIKFKKVSLENKFGKSIIDTTFSYQMKAD